MNQARSSAARDTDRTPQEQFAFQLPWERLRDIDRLLQADHEAVSAMGAIAIT